MANQTGILTALFRSAMPVIRYVKPADIPQVKCLAAASGVTIEQGRRDELVLVLDAPDDETRLAALCIVRLEHSHGHVSALIVDPRYDHHAVETRMLRVTEALCEALGVAYTDIGSARAA